MITMAVNTLVDITMATQCPTQYSMTDDNTCHDMDINIKKICSAFN